MALPLSYNAWAPTYIRVVVPNAAAFPHRAFTATTAGVTATGPSFTITGSGAPPPPPPTRSIPFGQRVFGDERRPWHIGSDHRGQPGQFGHRDVQRDHRRHDGLDSDGVTATVPSAPNYPNTGPSW